MKYLIVIHLVSSGWLHDVPVQDMPEARFETLEACRVEGETIVRDTSAPGSEVSFECRPL